MLVDFPREWNKYLISGKIMTFSKDTPRDIIEKAKDINKTIYETGEKYFFFFEDENESLV